MAGVPHVVHQTWREPTLPDHLRPIANTWRQLQPDWRHIQHSDDDNARYIKTHAPGLFDKYSTSFSAIQRADAARYAYMLADGGVYADVDVRLLRPLAALLAEHANATNVAILAEEPYEHSILADQKRRRVCNAVLISTQGHPFWRHVIEIIEKRVQGGEDPVDSTGPRFLQPLVERWRRSNPRDPVIVLKPDVLYPTWDPIQENTLRARCAMVSRAELGGRSQHARLMAIDQRLRYRLMRRICERLVADGFRPKLHGRPFTDHMWVHTWIPDLEKKSFDFAPEATD